MNDLSNNIHGYLREHIDVWQWTISRPAVRMRRQWILGSPEITISFLPMLLISVLGLRWVEDGLQLRRTPLSKLGSCGFCFVVFSRMDSLLSRTPQLPNSCKLALQQGSASLSPGSSNATGFRTIQTLHGAECLG